MILAIQLELGGMRNYYDGVVPNNCGLCDRPLQRAFFAGECSLHDPRKGTHTQHNLITCVACGLKVGKTMILYRLPTLEQVEECALTLSLPESSSQSALPSLQRVSKWLSSYTESKSSSVS